MIVVLLSENGNFIKADWLPKDQIAIFPVTEDSIIRAGKVISPHPLCDELSYLSKEIDPEKHKEYKSVLKDWVSYAEDGHSDRLLKILNEYIQQETILVDCITSLFSHIKYQMMEDHSIIINPGEKSEKIVNFEKTFVTFQIETESSMAVNLSVSTDRKIHQNYIDYVRDKNSKKRQDKCDISGEETYCVSRHRGLMGNAKLISISNHNETYFGRFDVGEEVVHIGYEVSQKIHLMLKYLLENSQNRKQLGESCVLINWFSDDISNEESINLINAIAPYEDMGEEDVDDDKPKTLGGSISSSINDYITGKKREVNQDGKFYLMILDKISNGRISIKYFQELPKADLFDRVEAWYHSTSWTIFNGTTKQLSEQTPSLFRYVDTIFGYENAKGYMECRISKLRTKTVERILPCILEHKRFPQDLKNRMLENLCHRNSYDKAWNSALAVGCSVFKKYQIDYKIKGEVSEMLDTNNQNRSYLYGRLLAVYEKLEQDSLRSNLSGSDDKRATNAERLWTAYTKMPARTLQILEEKTRPYKERLKKSNYGTAKYYDKITTNITNQLVETASFEQEKNRALSEDFIFGYYAQKQDFYKKQENKQNSENDNQKEGGNN
jgi:CRISPR-associated protein Csd1